MADSIKQPEVTEGSHMYCGWSLAAKIREIDVTLILFHLRPNGLNI